MANQDYSISSEGQAFNASGTTTLAVTSASGNVALPSSDKTVVVQNTGTVTAYVFIAAGSGTVATTSNTPVLAGDTIILSAGISGTYLAAITASSTTNLTITTGQGIPLILDAINVTIGQVTADATATAAAPSYVEGSLNPLSQTLTGQLRVQSNVAAGENHIGQVGGAAVHTTNSPTVTAGAYTTGQVVGGLISVAGAARINAGSGIVQTVLVTTKTALTAPYDILFFDTQPTNSTFTDNSALAVNVADLPFLCGVAQATNSISLGTPNVLQAANLAIPFKLSGASTTLYAVVVIRGSQSFASTSAVQLSCTILPD